MAAKLTQLLEESATRWPEQVALSDSSGGRALTYRHLGDLAGDLAAQLRRHGVSDGDPVGIVSDSCIEYGPALFAVLAAGGCAVPLNPALAAPQLVSRLGDVRARAVIAPEHLYGDFASNHAAVELPVLTLAVTPGRDGRCTAALSSAPVPDHGPGAGQTRGLVPPHPRDAAILMLTSGTTAAPKVVPLTDANLLASIDGIRSIYHLTPEDATLLVMPLFHGHGLIAGLLAMLASGGAGFMPSGGRFHAGRFWPEMAAARATWYTAVPTIHQILLASAGSEYPPGGYSGLRFVRSCSAPLAPAVQQDLESAFSAPVLQPPRRPVRRQCQLRCD